MCRKETSKLVTVTQKSYVGYDRPQGVGAVAVGQVAGWALAEGDIGEGGALCVLSFANKQTNARRPDAFVVLVWPRLRVLIVSQYGDAQKHH